MKNHIHIPFTPSLVDQVRASHSKVGRGAELVQNFVKQNVFQHVSKEIELLDYKK